MDPQPAAPLWRRARDRAAGSKAWEVVVASVGSCLRHRVTGLAAEAAFFAIMSIPPLLFALAGTVGYVSERFSDAQVADLRTGVLDLASQALTPAAVHHVIRPTLNEVLQPGRFDVVSIGFVLALWSGSRALNVVIDTITIMHGLGGTRGIVRARALSFALYLLGLLTGVVTLPLVVAGPSLVDRVLPDRLGLLGDLYWPVVLLLCVCFLATLYHVSVPVRTSWAFNLPGATFALGVWVVGSWVLREILTATAKNSLSIYGPLAAPIAILMWLYLVSIAVLIGAAVNAACDTVFPQLSTTLARRELVARLRTRIARVEPQEQAAVRPGPDDGERSEAVRQSA